MRAFCLLFIAAFLAIPATAQFAPQAGVAGSTAIPANSPQFVAWASACSVTRGFQQIDSPAAGRATAGNDAAGTGAPDGSIVSLGDSGAAVLRFASPITNGPGADFAVFENGFANTANPEEAFLELAFVEVSSDGIHFTRFPATSFTQDTVQISSVGMPSFINARQINNLAGKYTGGWGTPFDLAELVDSPGLDIRAITHVRIVDVIGSIGSHASRDAAGHKINDPFPSPFAGGGFDLDAVGVIHRQSLDVAPAAGSGDWRIYPNPAFDKLTIEFQSSGLPAGIILRDVTGRLMQSSSISGSKTVLSLIDFAPGLYFVTLSFQNGASCTRPFLHR